MYKAIKLLLPVLVLAWFAVSCASTSKATESKSEEAKAFEKVPDKGVVYLYRTGRAVGAAMQTQIKVNGKDAGGTGPGTFFKWELEPGTYTFSCFTPESSAIVELDVKPGKQYFLRQDNRMGVSTGRVTLKEVSQSTGEADVKKCKLLHSTYQ